MAVETPDSDLGFYGLMALLGFYVGVLPVTLGMLWLPFVRRIDPRWLRVLMALTIGLLGFLAIDATLEGTRRRGGRLAGARRHRARVRRRDRRLPCADGGGGVAAGPQGQRERTSDAGSHVALLVAIAIGLHNLGEGLAIGSAYAVGALALGAFLVIGFALHNTTEGLAIVAPVAARPPSFRRLALLGVIAGAPAILGAWIGASAFNSSLAALLLGAGAGAIVQVIQQLVPTIRENVGGSAARAVPRQRGRHPRRLRDPLRDKPARQRVSPVAAARTEKARPSEAIENYAKAIYALEQRGEWCGHQQRARRAPAA